MGASECVAAVSKKKTPTIVQDGEVRWNDDGFNLDSFGVEAPLRDRLRSLADSGKKPEEVSDDIRARYVKYVEKMKKKNEKTDKKAKK